jgi:hypothetical protein
MKNRDIVDEAIKMHQGVVLEIGTLCAHPSDNTVHKLVRYDGDNAVVISIDGMEKTFPAKELFEPYKVHNTAVMLRLMQTKAFLEHVELN